MARDSAKSDARLNFRLPAELKETIEQAAAYLGQSVSDFALSTLIQTARNVIQQHNVTVLSNRDRDIFLALLDDPQACPNEVLREAARKYKENRGRSA